MYVQLYVYMYVNEKMLHCVFPLYQIQPKPYTPKPDTAKP